MKIRNTLFITAIAVSIALTGIFFMSGKEESVDNTAIIEQNIRTEIEEIKSYPIPDNINFCGEKMPLDRWDIRERLDRELNTFAYLHATTMLYFKRANRIFPIIEPILKKNNIPADFKYLCVIESNLDTRAVSSANAVGLWQFMSATAKSYGLEITSEVDERYNIVKATEAACKYFNDAYRTYSNWISVAASYNAGMGRISSELRNQMADEAYDLLLVPETSRYMFRITAIKEIFENPRKYGFSLKKENFYPLIPTNKTEVRSSIPDLAAYATQKGLNYFQLKEFNPWLRSDKLTVSAGKSYYLDLPKPEDLFVNPNRITVYDSKWIK